MVLFRVNSERYRIEKRRSGFRIATEGRRPPARMWRRWETALGAPVILPTDKRPHLADSGKSYLAARSSLLPAFDSVEIHRALRIRYNRFSYTIIIIPFIFHFKN